MRSLKSIYTIPAHKSAVSDLKFFRSTASADALLAAPSVPRAFTKLAVFREDSTEAERDLAVKLEGMDVKTELSTNGTTSAGGRTVDFPLSGSFIVSSGYDGYINDPEEGVEASEGVHLRVDVVPVKVRDSRNEAVDPAALDLGPRAASRGNRSEVKLSAKRIELGREGGGIAVSNPGPSVRCAARGNRRRTCRS